MCYKQKGDDELKKIARDIFEGRIFTDRNIKKEDLSLLNSVFVIFNFYTQEQTKTIIDLPLGLIYEYVSEAYGTINEYPSFMSANILSQDDANKVFNFYKQYKTMQGQYIAG